MDDENHGISLFSHVTCFFLFLFFCEKNLKKREMRERGRKRLEIHQNVYSNYLFRPSWGGLIFFFTLFHIF